MRLSMRAAAVAVAGLALSACSANNGSGGSAAGVSADGTAKVVAKQLTVWTSSADAPYVRDAYTAFGKKFGVKINLVELPSTGIENQVQTRWASGARPDLLEYHATSLFWALNPAANLIDMSNMPYVERSGNTYKTVGSYGGKVYAAVTVGPGQFGMFYNKQVLAKAGLSAPTDYADIENICTVLKQKEPAVAPIFEAGGDQSPTQIQAIDYLASIESQQGYVEKVLAKKASLADPNGPFVAALTEYKKLQTMGCYNSDATTATAAQSFAALADGKAALVAQNSSQLSTLTADFGGSLDKTSAAIGWAVPSATGSVSAWSPSFNGDWYVPKTGNTATESTALAFIQWITTDGYSNYLAETGRVAALSGGTQPSWTGIKQQFADTYAGTKSLAFNSDLVGFGAQFPTIMTGLLSGQYTPAQGGQLAQQALAQGATAAHLPGW